MATIDKLNFEIHTDYQVDHSIPTNQKFSAWELNAMSGKTDEIIEKISGLIKGIKVRMIELPQSEKLEDYTNSYVNPTPKFFTIGRDEIVVIKHYIHSPSDNNVILGWNISMFSKGEGKWGHPGNDSTVTPVNIGDYIYLSTSILNETQTTIQKPVLNGNILTILYTGESGVQQSQTVDLSSLVTNDIYIDDADYDAAQNIITITRNDGQQFKIDLSEFSIIVSTDTNGVVTVVQEGVTKFTISKVGTTGSYNDLLDKPVPFVEVDTLQSVTSRGNGTTTPIILQPSEGRAGEINFSKTTYSHWFGNMNPAHTGTYNTAIGYGALALMTSGQSNVSIGGNSGTKLTTAEYSVFLGYEAGKNTTTGNSNTFIGDESGDLNTTGFKNTFIGTASGYNSLTGSLNTLLGYKSGLGAMTDCNTMIGAFSGEGVTGRNNVLIGLGSGKSDGAINNKLIIHSNNTLSGYTNTAEGNFGSFQQSQLNRALITGDFLDRWVRINGSFTTATPASTANDISIVAGSGILAAQLLNPLTDNYYVQKGWIAANYYNMAAIDSMIGRTYRVMGSKANFAALPSTGNKVGDVWNLLDTGDNYVWVDDLNNTGVAGWDKLSGTFDLSGYATIAFVNGKFIPFTGTGANQISGYLDFANNVGIRRIDTDLEGECELKFNLGIVEMSSRDTSPSGMKTLMQIEPTQINISSTSNNSRGITASSYYGNNIQENDFTQKRYITDNFIPRAGTTSAKPVTGDIYFNQSIKLINFVNANYNSSFTLEDGGFGLEGKGGTGGLDTFNLTVSQGQHLIFNSNYALSEGITSDRYYGDNYTDNSYVQKKFVTELFQGITGDFIPRGGTEVNQSVTGAIVYQSNVIFESDWSLIDNTASSYLSYVNGFFFKKGTKSVSVKENAIVIGDTSNGAQITIDPASGMRADKLFQMSTNFDYVQRGYVIEQFYNKGQVDSLITGLYRVCGSKNTYADLPPTEENREGDVWNIIDTGENYVWVKYLNNTLNPGWDKLSATIDLSIYATTSYVDNKFIPFTGNTNVNPITGRLNFKSATQSTPIFIDFGDQQAGSNMSVSLNAISHTSFGYSASIGSGQINISNDTTADQLNINPDTGIASTKYYGGKNDNDFIQLQDVKGKLRPYKAYVCLIQAGGTPTPSPNFIVLENSIGSITWARTNVGEYIGTLNGAFPANTVVCFAQSGSGNNGIGPNKNIICARLTDDSVFIKVTNNDDNATPFEFSGQFGSLEIRVYA